MYFDYILKLGEIGYYIECYIASIFVAPPADFLFVPIAVTNPNKIILYTILGFILSVLGGSTAYLLGKYLGRPIFHRLYKKKQDLLRHWEITYQKHAFSIVFGAALFIAPYNASAVASGILKMKFKEFLLASIIGRGLRFIALALAVVIWGEALKDHYVEIACFFGLIVIPTIWIIEARKLKKTNENLKNKTI